MFRLYIQQIYNRNHHWCSGGWIPPIFDTLFAESKQYCFKTLFLLYPLSCATIKKCVNGCLKWRRQRILRWLKKKMATCCSSCNDIQKASLAGTAWPVARDKELKWPLPFGMRSYHFPVETFSGDNMSLFLLRLFSWW